MSVIVNLFRMVAKEGFPPEYIATRLNETVSENNENGMFCTMFIGEIDVQSGKLLYCNAGHNPPVMMTRKLNSTTPTTPEFVEMEANAPIGLWPGMEYEGEEMESIMDMPLFIYSDGLNEAENCQQEQFSDERLLEILEKTPFESSRQMIELLIAEVEKHRNGAEPNDDLTMLCVKILRTNNDH